MKRVILILLMFFIFSSADAGVVSSTIIEDQLQADGRRWITAEITDSKGHVFRKQYKINVGVNSVLDLAARVDKYNERIKQNELDRFIDLVEAGADAIGASYTETTAIERADYFLTWAKDRIREHDNKALRYTWKYTENYTETQIDNLYGEGMGAKVKAWEAKIKAADLSLADVEAEGDTL